MYINFAYYAILFGIAFIAVGILWYRRNQEHIENWKSGFWAALILGGLFAWSGSVFTKNYIVIDEGNLFTKHECIGSPSIILKDGTEIDTRELKTGISGNWIFNATENDLVEYPVVYGERGAFNRNLDKSPDPYLIESGCCLKVRKSPDYYFRQAPASISVDEYWFMRIFTSIFGSKTVKWVIDVYSPEQYD